MSTGTQQSPLHTVPVPDLASRLEPVLDTRFALKLQHAIVVAAFATMFLLVNHLPLSAYQTWEHANRGQWILNHGRIPTEVPSAELADGMPFTATSWLSDVAIAFAANIHPEVISSVMAIATTFSLGLWFWIFLQASGRKRFALAATLATAVYWSFGLGALRSQVLGGMVLPSLFVLLWPMIQRQDDGDLRVHSQSGLKRWRVIGIFSLFVLWANLDISHLIGVAILVGFVVSVAIERVVDFAGSSFHRTGKLIDDRDFQQWILLTELAVLATFLNPAGFNLWKSLVTFDTQGPIWSVAGGSYGLRLATTSGALFGFLLFALVMLWLYRRWTVRVYEVVITVTLTLLTALHASCIYWFAPVLMFFVARHLRGGADLQTAKELTKRVTQQVSSSPAESQVEPERRPLFFAWSLICLLLIWFGFAFSPTANPVLGSRGRPVHRLYEESVPYGVGEFFANVPKGDLDNAISNGLVFSPFDWSDWLQWHSHSDRQPFVTSRLGGFPASVQRDYWKIFEGDQGWDLLVDKYRVSTLVIDRKRQSRLAAEIMRTGGDWRLVYESATAMIAVNAGLANEWRLPTETASKKQLPVAGRRLR